MAYDEALQNHKREFLKPKKQKAGTWVDDEELPPVGVKVSASSRDPATVKGIRHQKCSAKRLREKYHHKRNQLVQMDKAWRKGKRAWRKGKRVSWKAYRKLQTEVLNLAEESDAASWAKGEPFTDSQGVRRLEKVFEEASIVARAIDMYRERRRVSASPRGT